MAPTPKFDFKKSHRTLYSAQQGTFVLIEVPRFNYYMIDGAGDPNTAAEYRAAIESLYAASYTLKFICKRELQRDFVVPPLEGLWWSDDMEDFVARRKDRWRWTMMLAVPEFVDPALAHRALLDAQRKKPLAALSQLRFATWAEGRAVQTLHVGTYDEEGPILKRLHAEFLPMQRLIPSGHHHEIYLSDPRKTAAERLKTLLRQPVRPRS